MRLCLILLFCSNFLFGFNDENKVSVNPSFGKIINDFSYTRLGVSTNNLIIGRIGFYYTLEMNDINNRDLVGINIRLIKNLYFNFGYHFFTNENLFEGNRKEIGLTYNFNNTPFLIQYGYSSSVGSTIGVGYRLFLNPKPIKW